MDDARERDLAESTVLVVDDNPENLRVLREMLAGQGCAIRIARDGQKALRSVETSPPDVILLDIHMPEMDGYEVCRRLKADARFRDIPVIFLSALGETFNKVAAYDCGGADYITKPFQFEEIRVRLRAHLRTRHLLAESQAGFRSSFEQAAVGMAHLSLEGKFLRVNRRFCGMLGYTQEELQERSLTDVTCREFHEVDDADRKRVAEGAVEWVSGEKQYLRKDGERLWCRTTLSLVHVASTHEQYLAAIVEDVSDRKRVEEERRQLAAAIEQAAEAIVITDADGTAQYVNPAWERVSGVSRSETLGKSMRALLGGRGGDAASRDLWDTVASGRTWTGRLQHKRPDGSMGVEEVTASPVRDTAGNIVNFVAVTRDITGQLALESRLQRAQKLEAIGTLAGGIAHDFNNILSAIMGYTDLAISDLAPDSDLYSNLAEVAKASQRAKELVAQILAFSRQTDREIRPVRVQSIAKETLKLLRGSIPSTIEIREDIRQDCAPVLADPTGIHQILMNLGTNAYHAMQDEGGVLVLRLSQVEVSNSEIERDPSLSAGEYVRLEVHDTGHGMDEATLARIFEPYFTTKERGEGTGLGLATIHGIVSDLNGVIHVYSEPGEGSTFTVLLPCVHEDETAREAAPPTEQLRGTERVLLVDDEQPIGEFARTALERLGYRVTIQTSGPTALELFAGDPGAFDVIVTDQMMPRMKGIELIHKIHALRPDIPVILCSGFAETMRENTATDNNVQCHVMKPIIGADLARAIRTVVSAG